LISAARGALLAAARAATLALAGCAAAPVPATLWLRLPALPPGLVPTRLLRVEITALEIGADGKALTLAARWSIAEAGGTRPPVAHEAQWQVAGGEAGSPGAAAQVSAEAWALAHRRAIAMLAARVAETMAAPV